MIWCRLNCTRDCRYLFLYQSCPDLCNGSLNCWLVDAIENLLTETYSCRQDQIRHMPTHQTTCTQKAWHYPPIQRSQHLFFASIPLPDTLGWQKPLPSTRKGTIPLKWEDLQGMWSNQRYPRTGMFSQKLRNNGRLYARLTKNGRRTRLRQQCWVIELENGKSAIMKTAFSRDRRKEWDVGALPCSDTTQIYDPSLISPKRQHRRLQQMRLMGKISSKILLPTSIFVTVFSHSPWVLWEMLRKLHLRFQSRWFLSVWPTWVSRVMYRREQRRIRKW